MMSRSSAHERVGGTGDLDDAHVIPGRLVRIKGLWNVRRLDRSAFALHRYLYSGPSVAVRWFDM